MLVIEIADSGDGIPAESLGRIFDRFTRAGTAHNAQVGGVGLGLATVDAVARAHGGRCSVESTAAGSTFTLRLPGFEGYSTPGNQSPKRAQSSGAEPGSMSRA